MKFIKLTKIYSTGDFADIYLNVEEIESFQTRNFLNLEVELIDET